jgi:hypothetical protein
MGHDQRPIGAVCTIGREFAKSHGGDLGEVAWMCCDRLQHTAQCLRHEEGGRDGVCYTDIG